VALVFDGPYRLETFAVPPYDNNIYIVGAPDSGSALLIDAANDATRILRELNGRRLTHILTTHGHHDHTEAARAVREATKAQFSCHEGDAGMMPISPDHLIQDAETFPVGKEQLHAIHTPGHTPGSLCFLIGRHLISGDTLFPGGPGNTKNPYSSFPQIIQSIRSKLFVLSDDTEVLPGHGRPTTLGAERPHLDEWIARGW
jgi:glyoxylase-like metal-dependent hydrolase (beta-lactamase superfamily II)